MANVIIYNYKWEGKWGPFKIKTECGECNLSTGILKALVKDKYKGKPVTLEIKPWLNNWWRVIWRGAWHAPIIMVNNKIITQGKVVDRKKVIEQVDKQLAK